MGKVVSGMTGSQQTAWRRWLIVATISIVLIFATVIITVNLADNRLIGEILTYGTIFEMGIGGIGVGELLYPLLLGVAATFNPCGFAMLPAYLALYLQDDAKNSPRPATLFARALLVGFTMAIGVLTVFGIMGLIVAFGINSVRSLLSDLFGWAGLTVGLLMLVLGVFLLGGGNVYANWALKLSGKIGGSNTRGVRAYYLFGITFAITSLGCTLPLFLGVVAGSFRAEGLWSAFANFVLYAGGMCLTIILLTLLVTVFKASLTRQLRRVLPYIGIVSGVLVAVIGIYLLAYWLVIADFGRYFQFLKF